MSWQTVPLGDVADIVSGATPKTGIAEYWDGDIPWATPADLSGLEGALIEATPRMITAAGLASCAASILPERSVLLSSRAPIGHVAINSVPMATNQGFKSLVPRVDLAAPEYLYHWLKANTSYLQSLGNGATFKEVSKAIVARIEVPLPPLDEQRRIAALLDHVEGLRLQSSRVIAEVDQLEQSTFIEIFGEPISNPHGHPLERLGAVGKLDRGVSKHRPRNDPQLLGGPYPLIQTGDVTRSKGTISAYTMTYSEAGLAQSKLWPAGTLCITIAANIAQTGVLAFEACFPDSVVGFTADEATTAYVRTWLTFLQETLEAAAPQSAQRNINLAILRDLPIPLPPVADRKHFRECLQAIHEVRAGAVRRGRELDELFASIRYRALSGPM